MKRIHFIHILLIILTCMNMGISFAFWASSISGDLYDANGSVNIGSWDFENTVSIYTDFEDVSKGSYTSGDIETYGYSWLLEDALIGTLSSDLKNDTRSVRIREGYLQTNFTIANLRDISFFTGAFGSDSIETLYVELSDDLSTWESYTSILVTTIFTEITVVFKEDEVIALGLLRSDDLYIRFRYDDSDERVNVDDIQINYVDEEAVVVIGESFLTGFESSDGFVAATTYNNSTIKYEGNLGTQWGFYYGTPSTTSPLSESQSAQMRWYSSSPTNLGYIFTNFDLINLTSFTFLAESTSTIDLLVSISIDGGVSWIEDKTFDLSSSSTLYTYTIDSAYENDNIRIKFAIDYASTPANKARLYIDDVSIFTSE